MRPTGSPMRVLGLTACLAVLSLAGVAPAAAQTPEEERPLPAPVPIADDALTAALETGELSEAKYALERARSIFQLAKVRREFGYVARPTRAGRHPDPARPGRARRRPRRRRARSRRSRSSARPDGDDPPIVPIGDGWTAAGVPVQPVVRRQRLRPLGGRAREQRRAAGGGRRSLQRHPGLGRPDARDLGGRLVPGDRHDRLPPAALRQRIPQRRRQRQARRLPRRRRGGLRLRLLHERRPLGRQPGRLRRLCLLRDRQRLRARAVRRRAYAAGVPRGDLGARVPPRVPVRVRLARGLLADGGHRHEHRGDGLPGDRRQRQLPDSLEPPDAAGLPARPRRARQLRVRGVDLLALSRGEDRRGSRDRAGDLGARGRLRARRVTGRLLAPGGDQGAHPAPPPLRRHLRAVRGRQPARRLRRRRDGRLPNPAPNGDLRHRAAAPDRRLALLGDRPPGRSLHLLLPGRVGDPDVEAAGRGEAPEVRRARDGHRRQGPTAR